MTLLIDEEGATFPSPLSQRYMEVVHNNTE